MRSMRSAQRQVELRRLGNQLPVLGQANSLCKIEYLTTTTAQLHHFRGIELDTPC